MHDRQVGFLRVLGTFVVALSLSNACGSESPANNQNTGAQSGGGAGGTGGVSAGGTGGVSTGGAAGTGGAATGGAGGTGGVATGGTGGVVAGGSGGTGGVSTGGTGGVSTGGAAGAGGVATGGRGGTGGGATGGAGGTGGVATGGNAGATDAGRTDSKADDAARPDSSDAGSPATGFRVMTWVPSYSQTQWKAALETDTGGAHSPRNTITHLATQFFQVQSDGTVKQGVSDADLTWVSQYTKKNGIKFLVCIHNYIADWDWAVASSAFANNKTKLVDSIMALVDKWGADGVDIDFEGNESGDPFRTEFAAFAKDLGGQLHAKGKELTVDVFPYIWNQPNSNWWKDWVGFVDGVNSMGYDALYGGGQSWAAYRWQQDTALAAGYRSDQFDMGMPGWTGTWGSGGMGTTVIAHLNELLSGNYNRQPTSVCIWDAQFDGAGWLSQETWDALYKIRTGQMAN